MAQGPEAKLTKKLLDRLRGRGAWAVKVHGNIHSTGIPDIVACYRGRMLGLEVKVPGREGTLTKYQAHTLEQIKGARGIARVVTSVDQIDKILDSIDKAAA